MFDRLQVICTHKQDLQDWVELLSRQIKHTTATAPSHKPLTVPCHTVGNQLETPTPEPLLSVLRDVNPKHKTSHAIWLYTVVWWSDFCLLSDEYLGNSTLTPAIFGLIPQLPSHPVTLSRHAEGKAMTVAPTYHTLPHPSSHGTSLSSTMMWGPLEPPNTPKPWSLSCLRPAPPLRPSAALCYKEVSRISFSVL